MPNGTSSNPCSWFPPSEDRNTGPTCATSWMRCSTSRRPTANGVSCQMSSAPGPEFGPSFAGGHGAERGIEFSLHCTHHLARLLVERNRDLRWSSSTPTSHEEPRTGVSPSHDQGGPYGRTNGAKRIVYVDVTGLPLCVRVVPASTSEASAVEQILDDLAYSGADERLELVLVDRGTAVSAATRMSAKFNYEVRRVGWDDPPRNEHGAKVFRPIRHAWRVEVARPPRATATPGALLREHRDLSHRMAARRF